MSRRITVSTIQLPAWKESESFEDIKKKNIDNIFEMLEMAGKRRSDIAVFGEMANLRNIPFEKENLRKYADTVPGPLQERLCAAARKYSMNIIAPLIAFCDEVLRNTALIINREGKLIGQYFKVHLPVSETKAGIVAGDSFPVFDLDFGKIGVMICMDIEYPEQATILMLNGAEILFFPHVQSSWGEVDWEIRYRTRAIDTGLYLVSACYGIKDEDPWKPGMMIGRSGIIAPDGNILAEASRWVDVVTREIDLDRKRISTFHFGKDSERTLAIMASRRPELYRDIINPKFRDEALKRAKIIA